MGLGRIAGQAAVGLVLAIASFGCRTRSAAAPSEGDARDGSGEQNAAQIDPRCQRASLPERVIIERGQTVESGSGLAISYIGSMHDSYEDGRTDEILELSFRGEATEGAEMKWMPSAYAPPSPHYLPTHHCVTVVEAGFDEVVLEVASVDAGEVQVESVGEEHTVTGPQRPRIGSFDLCGDKCKDNVELKKSMNDGPETTPKGK